MTRSLLRSTLLGFALFAVAPAQAAVQAGVAAAVRGSVQLVRAPEVGRELVSGQAIHLGDQVRTGSGAQLQILLLDETVFTVGANSELVIDEFVYDPGRQGGKIDARLVKGVFRFITGKIARDEPENMNLSLPTGSIGIRGTIGGVVISPDETLVTLLGPGPFNDAQERPGGLLVSSAGVTRELLTPGFAVRLAKTGPPTPPFALDLRELPIPTPAAPPAEPIAKSAPAGETLEAPVLTRDSETVEATDTAYEIVNLDAEDLAGATTSSGVTYAETSSDLTDTQETSDELVLEADPIQTPSTDGSLLDNLADPDSSTPFGFLDGLARMDDLLGFSQIFPGTYVWQIDDDSFSGGSGSYDARIELDFGGREVRFAAFDFRNTGLGIVGGVSDVRSFSSGGTSDAHFLFGGTVGSGVAVPGGCCFVQMEAEFLNENGEVARRGNFLVDLSSGGGIHLVGSEDGVPIFEILP